MLRHRYYSSSNLSDGRTLDNRVRCISNGPYAHKQQELQCSDRHSHKRALLPETEHIRGNRNPPLLMVKPIKRCEQNDCTQNVRNDIKVCICWQYRYKVNVLGGRDLANASNMWAVLCPPPVLCLLSTLFYFENETLRNKLHNIRCAIAEINR